MWSLNIKQFNEPHLLNHRHMRGEKRYVVVTYSLIHKTYNPIKTHHLKQRHERRDCGGYLQPHIKKSMKLTS